MLMGWGSTGICFTLKRSTSKSEFLFSKEKRNSTTTDLNIVLGSKFPNCRYIDSQKNTSFQVQTD